MTRPSHLTALCLGLLLLPAAARAEPEDQFVDDPGAPPVLAAEDERQVYPAEEVDTEPDDDAPPVNAIRQPPQSGPQTATPPGEWVDTQQYGRVWMPYSDAYAYTPPGGYGEPYQYVYYPAYGWTWIAAPWIWGWGPWPTFGMYGPRHFGWYHHGWWRTPSRWHYAPSNRHSGFQPGFQPAPYRGALGGRVAGPSGFRSAGPSHRVYAAPGGRAPGGGGGWRGGGGRPSGGHVTGGHVTGGHGGGHFGGGHGR
jgi:hypothetical protein